MIAPLGATCQVTVEHHVFATRQSSNKVGYLFSSITGLLSLSLSLTVSLFDNFSQCCLRSLAPCKRASRQATSTHAIKTAHRETLRIRTVLYANVRVHTTLVRACVRYVLRVHACTYHAGYITAGCVFSPSFFRCNTVSSCALTLYTSRTS